MAEKIKGLALVALVDTNEEFLEAFLRHYLPWCEKALLVVCRLESESPLVVHKIAQQFGSGIRIVDYVIDKWDDFLVLKRLTRAVRECIPEADVLLHVDKDEFLSQPERLPMLVEYIKTTRIDFVDAQMVSRLAPGMYSFHALGCRTYEELCRVAPARCTYGDDARWGSCWGLKIFLTRTPFIRGHSAGSIKSDNGEVLDVEGPYWRRFDERMELEHFTWSDTMWPRRLKMYDHREGSTRSELLLRHWLLEQRNSDFRGHCDYNFLPWVAEPPWATNLPGDIQSFHHFYRQIVRHAPECSKVVMLGSSRLGRSVSWLCEYATLLGKKLHVFGYSHYDKDRCWKMFPGIRNSEDYHWLIRQTLKENAFWNMPSIIDGNLMGGAADHQDHSVFAVWVDLDLEPGQLAKVIKAWVPKLQPRGILGGSISKTHDVRKSLDLIGLPYLTGREYPKQTCEMCTWVAFPKT